MKLTCSSTNPPLGGLIVAEYVKIVNKIPLDVSWGNETIFENVACRTSNDLARAIAKLFCPKLYGSTILEMTEIDHWLTFTLGQLSSKTELISGIESLNRALGPVTYLTGKSVSIADFVVFSSLYVNNKWRDLITNKSAPVNVLRWYNFMSAQEAVKNILNSLTPEIQAVLFPLEKNTSKQSSNKSTGNRKEEGKFVELPGAEMGKVVVRFPPEASGFLHIGHAKAAMLNQYYQEAFQGKLIMRFDDTNPAKENAHFEKVILEDLAMLEIKPDLFTHTSQYFDLMLEYCEKLIKDEKAYVDDTEAELMKIQREQKVESPNRHNTVQQNFKMWEEMKQGTAKGQGCCVRAKIDMQSPNGCMRDPTIYRCKNELHPRTGDKYKVYPTYDFACPIVDAIEGVTHTLRTMEYHDRDPQFYWFIDALDLRKPIIWEYSRLSMTNTVLSKRKLTWFVNEGLVDGWDDPRMPTVRGVLRKGMTVEGLKEFIIAQGSSRSVVFMEWDKIWAFNKKVIDPIAPRYTAVDSNDPVTVVLKGIKTECISVSKHPKNSDVGNKDVWISQNILIDREDAEALKEGENATFINWGNILIKKIYRNNGKIINVEAEPNLDNKDYKKTLKLTWLAVTEKAPFTPAYCVYFDHIINKSLIGKDEDFKQFIGHQTRREVQVIGDPELKKLKKGDIIQLQRKGFFKVDVAYEGINPHTCKEQPIILFSVPDGHANENPLGLSTSKALTVKNDEKAIGTNKVSKTPPQLNTDIIKQGEIVRKLKEQKASKVEIDKEVKLLLSLKAEYKSLTNTDWKPGYTPADLNQTTVSNSVDPSILSNQISSQGEKVRQLKSQQADKAAIDAEVKTLLNLKSQYKSIIGKDWAPGTTVQIKQENTVDENTLLQNINSQGDKVRNLKAQKVDKATIDAEVKTLLSLKAQYQSLTGKDWKPGTVVSLPVTLNKGAGDSEENNLLEKITIQGDKIRLLKSDKADKAKIDEEVKILLQLKTDFKTATGKEWKPGMKPQQSTLDTSSNNSVTVPTSSESKESLTEKIAAQGNLVRDLKTKKASKEEIDAAVKILLNLKVNYKNLTGTDFPVQGKVKNNKPAATPKDKNAKQKSFAKDIKSADAESKDSGVKKQTRLGLESKKEENLAEWYSQVITKGELIEYYDVSGCYILRPWSFAIWEAIKDWFDNEIKKLGVQNCYFPIFVSKAALEKEKSHIADFSPEVAWVTKSGDSEMAEPVAVRPTSETVMYPAYAKWIQSYRDLPIKLNQWNNVVRWEFKHPQPFLRTREFLWQEGHSAFADKNEADNEVSTILDLYAKVYTDLLAIPVVKGRKTEKEKFAGGNYTLTVEAFVSASGRGIQGATSHHLGQNFSKMFDIIYEDPETSEKRYVYQNSWGITTRTIGVVVMIHADNQGLVLPPRVASIQTVIVPCGVTASLSEEAQKKLQSSCDALEADLKNNEIRVKGDYRSNYSPGWKFNHWELKGVPIRIEVGPKDIEKNQIIAVRRDTGEKITIPRATAVKKIKELLEDIHKYLYNKANNELESHKILLNDWAQFRSNLDKKNIILTPFCGDSSCEDKIKADSREDGEAADPGAPSMGAKALCIPLEQPAPINASTKCIHPDCQRKPLYYTLFGRSY